MATNLISLSMEYFSVFFFIYTRPAKLPGKCCEHQQKRVELSFQADKSEKTRKFIELALNSARMFGCFNRLSSLQGKNILCCSEDFPLSDEKSY